MKKQFNLLQTVMLLTLTAAVTFVITYYGSYRALQADIGGAVGNTNAYAKLGEIQNTVDKYFVGEYDAKNAIDGAAAGYVDGLGDKWSHYLTAEQYQSYKEELSTVYSGVGITVSSDMTDVGIVVLEVYADSPAQEAGILPLDVITKVDGESVLDLGYSATVKKVRGEKGTSLTLSIRRGTEGTERNFTMLRDEITKEYVSSKLIDGDVGYIRVTEFAETADTAFIYAIDKLQSEGAKYFVFDMRNNPGGSLSVLLNMLDRLMDKRVMFIEESKDGKRRSYESDEVKLDQPMAVLCNNYSISAAEYFTAVLQEYKLATVVGEATTGKGYGQNTIELSDGSALIISTIRYFTPAGKSLKDTGIKPDVEVPVSEEIKAKITRLEPKDDEQLQAAIKSIKK